MRDSQAGPIRRYPFSAIVGQERMKLALLLNAINPAIGGVLIRGEKGSAKSTSVRALAALLPDLAVVAGCPYACDPDEPFADCPHCAGEGGAAVLRPARVVDLPIGATEDRILGTLHLERALRSGERHFEPGLLAAAHRGILSIDEVNLLPDHLVDILLDAAAMGWNIVEREGISFAHPARFILIGTMNPEEGELRPQFLDRFGLAVDAEGLPDPADRAEVVRRRIAYETDPAVFIARWTEDERTLRDVLAEARERLPRVVLMDEHLDLIARICTEAGVGGLRADLTIHKAACTLAAYAGRTIVEIVDIRIAAELALPHRSRQPLAPDAPLPERVDDMLRECEEKGENEPDNSPPQTPDDTDEADDDSGNNDSTVFDAAPTRALSLPSDPKDRASSAGGRRGISTPQAGMGRAAAAVATTPNGGSFAVAATIRAAAMHEGSRFEREASDGMAVQIRPEDVRMRHREPPAGHCVLFVVDASGSMAAERRMAVAKGAALDLLADVYQRRDHVGLIAFRGAHAELVLPPTRSTATAEQRLRALPTGGGRPSRMHCASHGRYSRARRTAGSNQSWWCSATGGRTSRTPATHRSMLPIARRGRCATRASPHSSSTARRARSTSASPCGWQTNWARTTSTSMNGSPRTAHR
jgi:magnesium chelatase subunit D